MQAPSASQLTADEIYKIFKELVKYFIAEQQLLLLTSKIRMIAVVVKILLVEHNFIQPKD
jgi:hypothetical protein